MGMKQLFSNDFYQVMEISLDAGASLPQHKASSDAFLIVKEGSAKIIFSDNEVELQSGSTQLIPANKEHKLQVHDAFKACIILASEAAIKFL